MNFSEGILVEAGIALLALTLFVLASRTTRRICEHLRCKHPKVWNRYNFPDLSAGWVKASDDTRMVTAQLAYWASVRSGELRRLDDEKLNALLRRQARLNWLCVAAVTVLIAYAFVG